jgi:uncharacterized membrane protein
VFDAVVRLPVSDNKGLVDGWFLAVIALGWLAGAPVGYGVEGAFAGLLAGSVGGVALGAVDRERKRRGLR